MNLLEEFSKNWKQYFARKEPVLLAVSGGSDSMVMCHLFAKANIPFGIAHCNFQLRGDDAMADEQLVKTQAAAYDVPFYSVRFDTDEKTKEWKKGIQETARVLRYDWLEKVRAENDYLAIATAHHANDNAETLLMNIFKGTGMSGLHAIPAINNHIIRPLLFANKEDVRAYIKEHNVVYRDDASNASDKYLRNAVRHNLIPEIEKVFPNIIASLNSNIERFSEIEQVYNAAIELELKKLLDKRGNDIYISVRKLRLRTPLNTICYELFKQYGFVHTQVPQIINLLDNDSGSHILSKTHRVLKDREFLVITSLDNRSSELIVVEDIPAKVATVEGVFHFEFIDNPQVIPNDVNIALIDMSSIVLPLKLRRWKVGDYFYPLGMRMKKKKLSDFFIDNKVPIHQKERVWVVENNKKIMWVVGMRLDERFKLKTSTQKALSIRFAKTKNTDS